MKCFIGVILGLIILAFAAPIGFVLVVWSKSKTLGSKMERWIDKAIDR